MKLTSEDIKIKALELNKEYMRIYYSNHREEYKTYKQNYWEKKAKNMLKNNIS